MRKKWEKMRRVKIFKFEINKEKGFSEKVEDCEGLFLQFGIDCQEFNYGVASYSTVIVEMDDGNIKNVPVELVQFIKSTEK